MVKSASFKRQARDEKIASVPQTEIQFYNKFCTSDAPRKNDKLIRINDIVSSNRSGRRGYLPISKSTWWAGVAAGKFPAPVKLGPRITCWRESEVIALVNGS